MIIKKYFWICLALCLSSTLANAGLFTEDNRVQAESLPDGWQAGYLHDPVFNGQLYVVEAGVENANTLILVHGLGSNGWRDWRWLMPALSERYHVIALDLPGFGRSDKPSGRYSPSNYARVLSHLQDKTGRDTVGFMGHSMGGAVALRYAADYPERLNRLVLFSVAGVLQRSVFAQHSTALPLASGNWVDLSALPEPLREGVNNTLRRWGGEVLRLGENIADPVGLLGSSETAWQTLLADQPNLNAALALVEEDYTEALASVSTPTLILWGEDDPVAPVRTGYLLDGQLSSASLMVFPDMGHMPVKYPEKVNKPILGFLRDGLESSSSEQGARNQGSVQCQGQSGVIYQGRYERITLRDCEDIHLENVTASVIDIHNSTVDMRNVIVDAEQVALNAVRSEVRVTNAQFSGAQGLRVSASELDLAGVNIRASETAVTAELESELVFSVSRMQTPDSSQNLHGIFTLGDEIP